MIRTLSSPRGDFQLRGVRFKHLDYFRTCTSRLINITSIAFVRYISQSTEIIERLEGDTIQRGTFVNLAVRL